MLPSRLFPLHHATAASLFACLLLSAMPAQADRADREQPINIEADKVAVDDAKKVLVFEGNVVLTQGTMSLRAGRLVVSQDATGFQRGVAYGAKGELARFKQKREGRNDYVEGEGERIEHDARTEKTEFFVRAHVKSGGDEVRGNYISYDAVTERYLVTAVPEATRQPGKDGRVHAVIQPKAKKGAEVSAPAVNPPSTPNPATGVTLRSAPAAASAPTTSAPKR